MSYTCSYTLNKYSYEFFLKNFINEKLLSKKLLKDVKSFYEKKLDIKNQSNSSNKINFTEILAKFHNPLTLGKEMFGPSGFLIKDIHFYHFHVLPPIFEKQNPKLFRKLSLKSEKPNDWRGYFMASAFVVEAIKK